MYILFIFILLCIKLEALGELDSNLKAKEGLSKEPKPNEIFDASLGYGRTFEDCAERIDRNRDDLNRIKQEKLHGGKTARLGSECSYEQWVKYRLKFITTSWFGEDQFEQIGQFRNASYFLQAQIEGVKSELTFNFNYENYFERLCIACPNEALLECDQKTSKCKCWREYKTDEKGLAERIKKDGDDGRRLFPGTKYCRIRHHERCAVRSQVLCEHDSYCDRFEFRCKCTTHKASTCTNSAPQGLMLIGVKSILLTTTTTTLFLVLNLRNLRN